MVLSLQQARLSLGKLSQETDEELVALLCLINHWAELAYQTIENNYLITHNGDMEEHER